ncbi:twin-arginine translocase TatA/TatE family subunit [Paraglaciecola arctica]|uniref:twin-arginine translocase TatA/TatE family subunit n=1 Tax=Paraglaciecola arctica TaxID=1128911 RepID=UPI001C06E9F1|nr:twin-arginine translocase TatA/TatE family subunit [Paraglaciecola arctica]MBU3006204.1 twin-arginine translocase TatA/TatE family subunit [Paraglaciecola arctica]
MFGISPMQLLIILVIVVLLFGTKKLRGLGGDLGSALKGFKKAMSDDEKDKDADFVAKEKVEDKSTVEAEKTVQQTKSEQKEQS